MAKLTRYVRQKRRQIRSTKSGQTTERAKKWQFLEIVNFLDRYVEDSRYHYFQEHNKCIGLFSK